MRNKVWMILTLLTSNQLFAFGSPPPAPPTEPQPAPEKPLVLAARWEGHHRDARSWTEHTFDEIERLGPSLMSAVPSDYSEYCSEFSSLRANDRKNFWTYLVSAMAQFESSFDPDTAYRENFKDQHGNFVISRGLLQLSIESGNGYGCGFDNSSDLHDPYQNLSCAIRILDRWVGRDKIIGGRTSGGWRGGARYWSVLRDNSKTNSIKSYTKSFCRNHF